MKDRTLEQDPDFTSGRSPVATTIFATLAIVALLGLVLVIVFYGDLSQNESVSWRGRTSTSLGGIVAPGAVVICAFLAFLFGWLTLSGATRWVRLSTGTAMRGFELRVAGDAAVGDELHRRLATGDPAQYLPIPVAKKGQLAVRVYRADADRRAFVTVQLGTGPDARTWPLIELRDRGFVQIKRRTPEDFAKPYVSAGASTDPTLRS